MPPLDMTFAWLSMRIFGADNFAIRIPPTFFGIMSCVIFALTITKLSNLKIGTLAGILAAVTPALVFQQQTARPYALYTFLIVSIFYFSTGNERRNRLWMVIFLTFLPWSRALEGPVSTVFLSITFVIIIIHRKKLKFNGVKEVYIFIAPILSAIYSVQWTKNTESTIIGAPDSYINNFSEAFMKLQTLPEFILTLTKVVLGFNFIIIMSILIVISLALLPYKKTHTIINSSKPHQALITSLSSLTLVNFLNSITIFIALYCLTKLQFFDRYFSLGIFGWIGILVMLVHFITQSKFNYAKYFSNLLIVILIVQYVFTSYHQAIRIDKIQFDQVNNYILSNDISQENEVIVFQSGDFNQYLPGWPVSIGTNMQVTPTWLPYVIKRIYLENESVFGKNDYFSTIVLLPKVDSRSNLLIGQPWANNMFKASLDSEKITYLPGGAYILNGLSKAEMLRTVDVVLQSSTEGSNLWISAYGLALAESSGFPASEIQILGFCRYLKINQEITQGTSFGLWGQPNILTSEFFQKSKATYCDIR